MQWRTAVKKHVNETEHQYVESNWPPDRTGSEVEQTAESEFEVKGKAYNRNYHNPF